MQEKILSNQEETERIVQLLLSENEESILLGLQLIEAVGINRRLMSYVMVYSLYSSNENICIAAFDLFSQCANDSLKRHVYQKWDRGKLSDATYSSQLFTYNDIDSFDCVVAFHHCWQMYGIDNVTYNCINEYVLWRHHYQEDLDENTIGYFVLNDFENIEVNTSILQLKYLSNINIFNVQNIDLQCFVKIIDERESIYECFFKKMNIVQNIDALFQISHLRSLAFIKSKVKTLPKVIDAPHLKSLVFFKITDFQAFPDLSTCSGLVELSINHCEIKEILPYAANKKLHYLDLSNNQIEHLPSEICFLRKLNTLKLDNNKIKSIDEEIRLFPQLSVTLHHNLLQEIHCDFNQKDIDLSHNQLTEFPSYLLKDPQRETINISFNEISTFEFDSVPEDSKLKSLNLDNNQLLSLPDGLEQFVYLERLDFSKNQLTSIPVALFSHQKLENFYFSHNKIEFVPNDLSKMRNLAYLNFQSNQIKALPMMLPIGIKNCDYRDNPISKEDADIFELLFPEDNGLPF